MVNDIPLVYSSSSTFLVSLRAVLWVPARYVISIILIFYNLFSYLTRSRNFSHFSISFISILRFATTAKFTIWKVFTSTLDYYYYFNSLRVFFYTNISWCLSLESEWQQVLPGTVLRILADVNNAVVWMVSIAFLISSSSNLFFKPLGTNPSTASTIDIRVTPCSQVFLVFWEGPSILHTS